MASKGTPRQIIDTLNAAVRKALETPEVRDGFLKQSFHPAPMTPEETSAFLRAEYEKWSKVVRDASIKVN
jgi:tripartite-type tricarboxylate transporter receptor subunit TctC